MGSKLPLEYFSTEFVGLTARFCKEANRLMMASAIPMPQVSSIFCPRFSNGRTAMLRGADAETAAAGIELAGFAESCNQYAAARTTARITAPAAIQGIRERFACAIATCEAELLSRRSRLRSVSISAAC